jgi:hypothetical protein
MPMYQKATPKEIDDYCKVMKKENFSGCLNPRKIILVTIMQYACAYHAEKLLPPPFSGMVLN